PAAPGRRAGARAARAGGSDGVTTPESEGGDPSTERPSPEERLRAQFPDVVEEAAVAVNFPTLTIRRDAILSVCEFVKNTLGYKFPACASGVDRKDHLEVVYHVYSLEEARYLGLKVKVPYEDARVDAVTTVWAGMDWHEREIFDLLGVRFE